MKVLVLPWPYDFWIRIWQSAKLQGARRDDFYGLFENILHQIGSTTSNSCLKPRLFNLKPSAGLAFAVACGLSVFGLRALPREKNMSENVDSNFLSDSFMMT
jgi:hypothetical protein